MKLDNKKKIIQAEYRKKIQQKRKVEKENKNYNLTAFIITTILVLFFLLNYYFKTF